MYTNATLKTNNNSKKYLYHIFFILIVLRLLTPSFIASLIPSLFFLVLDYVSMLVMILFLVSYKFKPNLSFWLIVASLFFGMISTSLNGGALFSAGLNYFHIVLECAFLILIIDDYDGCIAFMTVVRNITLFFAMANLLVGIVMPRGIPSISTSGYAFFLYGNVNSIMRSIMPGICCSMLLDKKHNKTISLSTILFFASILYFCFRIYFMATSFIGVLLLLTWIIFKSQIKKNYVKVYLGIVIVVVLIEFFVVFLYGNSLYSTWISSLFSTKSGFSGREYLWSNIIYRINGKELLGYGFISDELTFKLIGNTHGSHNYYLDIVFQRGILGLIPLLILFLIPIVSKIKNISDECFLLLGACCGYYVMFLMEPFVATEFFHLPVFCVAITLLMKDKKRMTVNPE